MRGEIPSNKVHDDDLCMEENAEDEADDEPLALEENEETGDRPIMGAEEVGLLSPPRNWPDCFSSAKLKSYVMTELKGRRVRLSEAPEPEHVRMAAGMKLSASDALGNAVRLRDKYGWDVLGGFTLYESLSPASGAAHGYTSRPHYWNSNARGLWLDLTPRPDAHASKVLVESPETKPRPKLPPDRTAAIPTQKDRVIVEVDRTGVTASRAAMFESLGIRVGRRRSN